MPALTGDVTMTAGTTITAIAAGAILDADINASAAIARSKIAAESAGNGPGNVLINDGSGNISSLQCNNGEVIKFDGAGVAVCGVDTVGTGDVINGGNTVVATMTVGTNSNHNLEFETNGTTKMTLLANGNVGIGTTNPLEKIVVDGSLNIKSGQIYADGQVSSAVSPLVFNTALGNSMVWSNNDVTPTANVHNMKAGGSYMLILKGTGTGAVTINCFSDSGTTALPTTFQPPNSIRASGITNKTIYTLISDGENCLITWITGF